MIHQTDMQIYMHDMIPHMFTSQRLGCFSTNHDLEHLFLPKLLLLPNYAGIGSHRLDASCRFWQSIVMEIPQNKELNTFFSTEKVLLRQFFEKAARANLPFISLCSYWIPRSQSTQGQGARAWSPLPGGQHLGWNPAGGVFNGGSLEVFHGMVSNL